MKKRLSTAITLGKLVRQASRVRGRGGSALPGLVVEKLLPTFLPHMLAQLPEGVVVVTGTNGKTTTTKMIADLLTSLGKKVLTNRTGSNFTRGIVATVVHEAKVDGSLDYDIAVIELDEAYAKKFVQLVKPAYVVALNVMRDQLDRFGEIDTTARLIEAVLKNATEGCVINRDDPHLAAIGKKLDIPVTYYAVDQKLRKFFPTDEELQAVQKTVATKTKHRAEVELLDFRDQTVSYAISNHVFTKTLQINGQYNFQNAAAALALVHLVVPKISSEQLLENLASVQPAFGRGETLQVNGQPLEIILVKNPAGFRQALLSFASPANTMIAINDNYADGRDMSWLWDVDFTSLREDGVNMVSGIRAFDMALRLQYEEVLLQNVDPDLNKALDAFVTEESDKPRRIFCTYTAMLAIRNRLGKDLDMEQGV